jgi:hypothetical protein
MGTLQQIEAAAQGIIEICKKDRTTGADKDRLLKLQAEIFTGIENLVECESCGSITSLIVTMTLDEVTAKVCKECGIKALEAGKIQKSTTRRRPRKKTEGGATAPKATSTTKSKQQDESAIAPPKAAPAGRKATPDSSSASQTGVEVLYEEVEGQTQLKKADIKRIHKIIQEIATPMNLEHTVVYVEHEAELAKLKINAETLREAVKLLMDK